MSQNFSREHLRSFVERVENVEGQIKEFNDDKRDIYAEAKGHGYNIHVLKAIIARRRKDPDKLAEFDAVFDTYCAALEAVGTDDATRARTRPEPEPATVTAALTVPEAPPVRPVPHIVSSFDPGPVPEALRRAKVPA